MIGPAAQSFLTGSSGGQSAVELFALNAPVESPPYAQCGRVTYAAFAAYGVNPQYSTVPSECVDAPFSPQELALEFMFFDTAMCVQADHVKPVPPCL